MFLKDYSLDIIIYDEEGISHKTTGNACFRPVKNFNKDISKVVVELDPNNSRYTTTVNSKSFLLLRDWMDINADYKDHKSFIIDEGIQPKYYYFNLCVYLRLSFEWLYMPTLFTYQAVFGKEFDQQKLLITQAFQDYVGLYCGDHAITNGTIYLENKLSVDDLKERFKSNGIYRSWQKGIKHEFNIGDAYEKYKTLIGVYEQFEKDLHSK